MLKLRVACEASLGSERYRFEEPGKVDLLTSNHSYDTMTNNGYICFHLF